ncbi:hypothetical protein O181_012806 [Austropuccinia psidii MF-1]|uniref:HAT C-terminal dimerisation domain-containing protein n=1 Tax=Austropuccinia psidii MF-1 TaxID=1389203 RepID=A0A9Q3BYI0_9BASI|nr:hypothetical protein [Austropuccinia psidii MF-1]
MFTACTDVIGCMAYKIHLAAQDGLNSLAQGPLVTTNEPEVNMNGPMSIYHILDLPDGVNAIYDSIINQISRLSSYIQQSPQRQEKFIGTVNLIYDKARTNQANTLLSNICTHWNSSYDILQLSLALKDACIQYCSTDSMHAYCLTEIKWGKVLVMLSDIFQADGRKHMTTAINMQTTNTDPANNLVPTSAGKGLFDDMYSLSSSEGSTLEKEIQRFFAEPTEPKDTNIILFWKSRVTIFPTLAHMARKYLSIPATNAPSERVFSCGRKILSYQCVLLSSMHVE